MSKKLALYFGLYLGGAYVFMNCITEIKHFRYTPFYDEPPVVREVKKLSELEKSLYALQTSMITDDRPIRSAASSSVARLDSMRGKITAARESLENSVEYFQWERRERVYQEVVSQIPNGDLIYFGMLYSSSILSLISLFLARKRNSGNPVK